MNKFIGLLCCMMLLLVACAGKTEVMSVWKNEAETGKIGKVFVLAILKEPSYRRTVEYGIINLLNDESLRAVPTLDTFPDIDDIDETLVQKIMDEYGIDSVLLVRLVDSRVEKTYIHGTSYNDGLYGNRYAGGWHNYYGAGLLAFNTPGYVTEDHVSTVETAIYDIKTDKALWTTVTETTENSPSVAIASYLKTIDKSLEASGLFN